MFSVLEMDSKSWVRASEGSHGRQEPGRVGPGLPMVQKLSQIIFIARWEIMGRFEDFVREKEMENSSKSWAPQFIGAVTKGPEQPAGVWQGVSWGRIY